MWWLLSILLVPSAALAGTWTGTAEVRDGDTLTLGGQRFRLMSVDAFESEQVCYLEGRGYHCGDEATRAMRQLVGRSVVTCVGSVRDRSGRVLAHCSVDGRDLGAAIVRSGWAVAEWRPQHRADEAFARAAGEGAWSGTFIRPREWRKRKRAGLD